MPFGQVVNLSPEVSVLLPDSLQLCLDLGGRAVGFESQPVGDGLFSTFRCHGYFVGAETSADKQGILQIHVYYNYFN